MNKVRIGLLQLFTLLANLVYGKAIGYTNGTLARVVGNDMWLSMSFAFLAGMAIMPALVWLSRRRGNETPMEYIPKLLGRPLGAVVLLVMACWFYVAYMTSAITIAQHINDYLMTETPLLVFVALYTVLIIYAVYLGIESIARLSVLGLLMAVLLNISMTAGSVPHMNVQRLLPLFDHGVLPVVAASTRGMTDVGMATAASLLLMPLSAGSAKRWLPVSLWALATGLVLVVVWSIFEVTVLGPEVTAQFLVSCMQMARAAELSIYLHRYELIMVIFFVYSVITQSTVCLYCAVGMTSAILPFRVRRSYLILGCGLATIVPEYYLAVDRDRYGAFLGMVWPPVSVAVAFGLPLLLCLAALFRPAVKSESSASTG